MLLRVSAPKRILALKDGSALELMIDFVRESATADRPDHPSSGRLLHVRARAQRELRAGVRRRRRRVTARGYEVDCHGGRRSHPSRGHFWFVGVFKRGRSLAAGEGDPGKVRIGGGIGESGPSPASSSPGRRTLTTSTSTSTTGARRSFLPARCISERRRSHADVTTGWRPECSRSAARRRSALRLITRRAPTIHAVRWVRVVPEITEHDGNGQT